MGTVSIVLGIIGICLSWLPHVGWLGFAMGGVGCGLGVLSITHWHAKAGYTAWGISGLVLGVNAAGLALAYQIKHAAGSLDQLHYPLTFPVATIAIGSGVGIATLGILLARRRQPLIGLPLAALAIFAVSLFAAWTITTADRAMEAEATVANHDKL